MMRACRSVGSVLSLILPVGIVAAVAGCQPETPAPAPPAPHPTVPQMTVQSAADPVEIQVDPGVKAGVVSSVHAAANPKDSIAAIVHVDVSAIRLGDIATFTDHQLNVVANGRVTVVEPDANPPMVTTTYEPTTGGRAPRVGDWVEIRPQSK
jgi:hypothetical protein